MTKGSTASERPRPARRTKAAARHDALFELQRNLTRMVRWASNSRLHAELIASAQVRIDRAAFTTLAIIGDAQPVRSTQLSASYGLDLSTISKSTRDLEKRGLVERKVDPRDQRASELSLTPRGEQTLALLRRTVVGLHDRCMEDWTVEEMEQFAALSARYADALSRLFDDISKE
jgi:DNA-binding MarR family transcriptional regulator